ncbi:MAG TPA: hypothetical protein VGK25_04005, partial [Ignavibacteria bacterium]
MQNKLFYILALSSVIFGSCKKGYLDVNEVNPNQTENPPINGLLASVTYQTGLNIYRAGNVTSYYVQQLASPNASSGSDIYDNVDRSSLWFVVATPTSGNAGGGFYNTIGDIRV